MKHCQRPEHTVHRAADVVQPHFVAVGQGHSGCAEAKVPQSRPHRLVPGGVNQVLIRSGLRLVQGRVYEILGGR